MVKAMPVSKKKDGITFCKSNYSNINTIEVNLDNYKLVKQLEGELPKSDEEFPKGAAISKFILVDQKIYEIIA
jgi:hypothetical protein